MGHRALLTTQYVDAATPPQRGELWISDTELQGFGLRLWATKSGTGKAFSIRCLDQSGRQVRRSTSYWDFSPFGYWRREHELPSLGFFVDQARAWAGDELDRLKGKPTLRDEEIAQRARSRTMLARVSLQQAEEAVLSRMADKGISLTHRDRLDKLFATHVPQTTKQLRLLEVPQKEIVAVFKSKNLSQANLRVLRPFLGRIFDLPFEFGARGKLSSHHLRGRSFSRVDAQRRRPEPKTSFYNDLFHQLESDQCYWQQALCLRLFLSFHAPLSQLMAARWDQVRDYRYMPRDGSRPPFGRRTWEYSKITWRNQQISNVDNSILLRVLNLGRRDFPGAAFWFPSHRGQFGHIRAIDHSWRKALAHVGSTYASPKVVRDRYQSYRYQHEGWWLERAYDPLKEENVADLSKKSEWPEF